MKSLNLLPAIVLLLSCIFLGGCFSANPADIAAWKKPYEVNVTSTKYILQPADQIQAICPAIQDINVIQTIRPDGKVSFVTIGEVEAAGRTPGQLADAIRDKASKLYNLTGDHPIDVRIATYQSAVYYVLGQVDRPGPRLYSGRNSALKALADSNPNVLAWGDHIQVIRPAHCGGVKPKIFEIKWDPMVVHGDATKDVLLEEGDIIYVPPTVLASIALTIAEFVRPLAEAFSVPAPVASGTTPNVITY